MSWGIYGVLDQHELPAHFATALAVRSRPGILACHTPGWRSNTWCCYEGTLTTRPLLLPKIRVIYHTCCTALRQERRCSTASASWKVCVTSGCPAAQSPYINPKLAPLTPFATKNSWYGLASPISVQPKCRSESGLQWGGSEFNPPSACARCCRKKRYLRRSRHSASLKSSTHLSRFRPHARAAISSA